MKLKGTSLIILAAGQGRRFGGLKQVQPVGPGGEALLEYAAYDARRLGFDRVVIVTRPDIEAEFRQDVGRRVESAIETVYVHQTLETAMDGAGVPPGRTKPWGTGHALLAAAPAVQGPFAVVNADDFYGPRSYPLVAGELECLEDEEVPQHALIGFRLDRTLSEAGAVSRGVCSCTDDGWLERVTERTHICRVDSGVEYLDEQQQAHAIDPATIVSMNMWAFGPSILPQLQALFAEFLAESGSSPDAEFGLPTAVNRLMRQGKVRVRVAQTSEAWCGMTYEADTPLVRDRIRELVAQGSYPPNLWS